MSSLHHQPPLCFRWPLFSVLLLLFLLTVTSRMVPCDTFSWLPLPPRQSASRSSVSVSSSSLSLSSFDCGSCFLSRVGKRRPMVGQQQLQNAKRSSLVISPALPFQHSNQEDASSHVSRRMITAAATTMNHHHHHHDSVPVWSTAFGRILSHTLLACSVFLLVLLPVVEPAAAGLLDDYGADPTKIVPSSSVSSPPAVAKKKGEQGIDPTLRACTYARTVALFHCVCVCVVIMKLMMDGWMDVWGMISIS